LSLTFRKNRSENVEYDESPLKKKISLKNAPKVEPQEWRGNPRYL